jgi:hypothetical protein
MAGSVSQRHGSADPDPDPDQDPKCHGSAILVHIVFRWIASMRIRLFLLWDPDLAVRR